MTEPYIFVAYARQDFEIVERVVAGLKQWNIRTWIDVAELQPGQQWQVTIQQALQRATGMLVFVSRASMKSEWVRHEVEAAARGTDYLIIPVILEHTDDLPLYLQERQWLDLTQRTEHSVREAIEKIAIAVRDVSGRRPEALRKIAGDEAEAVASQIAEQIRHVSVGVDAKSASPDSVFLVHGSDIRFLEEVDSYLTTQGVNPVVLTKISGAEQSLFQKFLKWGGEAKFAIVLFSADDLGAARVQYEHRGIGEKALQFRARQNVILELGFFYGRLGWENVFTIFKPPGEVFPNFEPPSDLGGVVFVERDPGGEWKDLLLKRLRDAGFELRGRKKVG